MLPHLTRTAIAGITALSLSLGAAAPAQALGKNERSFLKGVAATLIVGALINEARRQPAPQPRVVAPRPQPIPVHGGGYSATSIYRTPAAQAFNSYGREERRVIQQKLAAMGYYRSGIDGAFGPGTYNAVVAYARDTGGADRLSARGGAYSVYDSLIY
jgi:peptidoglycan hydrolase-like protein with peptidoglycan-binding domain